MMFRCRVLAGRGGAEALKGRKMLEARGVQGRGSCR
jgi:hypothetical protein